MSLHPSLHDREFAKFRDDSPRGSKIAVTLQNELLNIDVNQHKTYTVGEPISALRAVYLSSSLIYTASSSVESKTHVIGIALSSVNSGTVSVQERGDLYDTSFSFVVGEPVFLSSLGELTQTPPITGFRVRLGTAIAVNGIRLAIEEPIEL